MYPDIAKDATQPPLVLILDVGAITSLVDLDSENIISFETHIGGNVEFGWISRALRVADILAVQPNCKSRVNTFKAKAQLVVLVFGCNLEIGHVASALVLINGDMWSVHGKRVVDVGIMRALSEALKLPHARDMDGFPVRIREGIKVLEAHGTYQRRLGEIELPLAREKLGLGQGDITS